MSGYFNKTLWVLGAGQLGNMLQHAGYPLGVDVKPIDIDAESAPVLDKDDVVTAEREEWPKTPVTNALSAHNNFANQDFFATIADRFLQKSLLDKLGLATAPWQLVKADDSEAQIHQNLGERVLLKRRKGGYDGRGQHWLKQAENSEIPADWHENAIAEQAINFDEEVSLIGVRDQQGQCYFYPLTLNLHQNGILTASISPLDRLKPLQATAEAMLTKLMDAVEYVGVMAMECFHVEGKLLINEIAPRVHNSGHWTQAGSNISQFESHVRCVTGLPMIQPSVRNTNFMINLIGCELDKDWLAVEGSELFWYQKSVRPGRKVGHINFSKTGEKNIQSALEQIEPLLPEQYQETIAWLKAELLSPSA
ncbi:5-(carboxyamino)imidazole ribonucleotide synthase [Catenovulum sp. 2E275]|uniref:5-(carboxyamino)imidazole ribonucleotide synthase n=1 Tax=Catenovulum sp. 2E275 TaxID=2980497 RepID=UPI0021D352A5|nr:5-(carboxyamino)imidazole ribonucleotide synthase [Catenovulum sp. 2E275]MCU4674589.1 5-(carboxyamino)imidazole ribonucleotide synthase [Catenovulum sp. 2E275]